MTSVTAPTEELRTAPLGLAMFQGQYTQGTVLLAASALLLADLSGFSTTAHRLEQRGVRGTEDLTDLYRDAGGKRGGEACQDLLRIGGLRGQHRQGQQQSPLQDSSSGKLVGGNQPG